MGTLSSAKRYQRAPTRQVAHTVLAVHGRHHQEGRQRHPKDGAERLPKRLLEWQDVKMGPNRWQRDRADNGIGHDQEGRHRMAGHQPPER